MEIEVLPREAEHLKHVVDRHGNLRLAKKEDGSCVYLVDDKCSIYEERPHTCRTYDCRVPNLLYGWRDAFDPVMDEAISQWAPLRTPLPEDADMVTAMRMAVHDGGTPDTWEEAYPKIMRWEQYMERARELRDRGRMLDRIITVNGREGRVIGVKLNGNLVVDLRASGGSIGELRLLMKMEPKAQQHQDNPEPDPPALGRGADRQPRDPHPRGRSSG
jgi:Fe-S-cluster containining protein